MAFFVNRTFFIDRWVIFTPFLWTRLALIALIWKYSLFLLSFLVAAFSIGECFSFEILLGLRLSFNALEWIFLVKRSVSYILLWHTKLFLFNSTEHLKVCLLLLILIHIFELHVLVLVDIIVYKVFDSYLWFWSCSFWLFMVYEFYIALHYLIFVSLGLNFLIFIQGFYYFFIAQYLKRFFFI